MLSCYVIYLFLIYGLNFLFKNLLQCFRTYVPFGNIIRALVVAVRIEAVCLQVLPSKFCEPFCLASTLIHHLRVCGFYLEDWYYS